MAHTFLFRRFSASESTMACQRSTRQCPSKAWWWKSDGDPGGWGPRPTNVPLWEIPIYVSPIIVGIYMGYPLHIILLMVQKSQGQPLGCPWTEGRIDG